MAQPCIDEPIKAHNQLMTPYNWQRPDWPHFRYDLSAIHDRLFAIAEKTGLIHGKLAHRRREWTKWGRGAV